MKSCREFVKARWVVFKTFLKVLIFISIFSFRAQCISKFRSVLKQSVKVESDVRGIWLCAHVLSRISLDCMRLEFNFVLFYCPRAFALTRRNFSVLDHDWIISFDLVLASSPHCFFLRNVKWVLSCVRLIFWGICDDWIQTSLNLSKCDLWSLLVFTFNTV